MRTTALVVITLLCLSCASRRPPGGMSALQARVDADRLFTIVVQKDGTPSGCKIVVDPDSGTKVVVKAGWKVAWNLVNLCDQTQAVDLKFVYVEGGRKQAKEPVNFRPFFNGVLQGKVKKKGWFTHCEEYEDAPCGKYKYTVHVGPHVLDPDWEIIVY